VTSTVVIGDPEFLARLEPGGGAEELLTEAELKARTALHVALRDFRARPDKSTAAKIVEAAANAYRLEAEACVRDPWAAAVLAGRGDLEAYEALVRGVAVPRHRLNAETLDAIGEAPDGPDVALDDELALRLRVALPVPAAADKTGELVQLRVVEAAEFAAVDEASAQPLLGDEEDTVLSAGGALVFYGDGGAGKTTIEVDLVCHLASGSPWLGLPVPAPVRILIVENEGPRGKFRRKLRAKLAAWKGPPIDDRILVLEEPWALFTFAEEAHREALRVLIEAHEVDVVAAGPVQRLGMQGGGTPDEVGAFMLAIELTRARLARPLAVLLVHHENKAGDVSGAWEGVPDTLAHVQAQGNGATRVHWRKVRWGSTLHGTTWKMLWRPGESFELEDQPAQVSDGELLDELDAYLTEHPGATTTAVIEAIGKRADRVRSLLTANAEHGGRYTVEKGPKGAKCWSLQTNVVPLFADDRDDLADGQGGNPHE
jgi:hypothetical protein